MPSATSASLPGGHERLGLVRTSICDKNSQSISWHPQPKGSRYFLHPLSSLNFLWQITYKQCKQRIEMLIQLIEEMTECFHFLTAAPILK